MTCDPCQFCRYLYDDSDLSVGLYGYGCAYVDNLGKDEEWDEWEPGCGRPCRGFQAIPVSEDLREQIANEEEARFWAEYEEEEE